MPFDAFGMAVRVGPDHIVLDGNQLPMRGTAAPKISAGVYCGQMAAWIKIPIGTEVGLSAGDTIVGIPHNKPLTHEPSRRVLFFGSRRDGRITAVTTAVRHDGSCDRGAVTTAVKSGVVFSTIAYLLRPTYYTVDTCFQHCVFTSLPFCNCVMLVRPNDLIKTSFMPSLKTGPANRTKIRIGQA